MPTNVYVDGFNLYFALLKYSPHKWLNLERLFQRLRPDDSIETIWYFTAKVAGPTRPHQELYWKALSTTPRVRIVEGNFKRKRIECKHPNCPGVARRFFWTYEEKRTDVNIALQILDDAYRKLVDHVVLVSGDSDMVPALELLAARFPQIKRTVYIPAPPVEGNPNAGRAYKSELRSVANTVRLLPGQLLPLSQFDDPVSLADGTMVHKPAAWFNPERPRPAPAPECPPGNFCSWCQRELK